MEIVQHVAEVDGWYLDFGSEGGSSNRVATKFVPGGGYQIESQVVWYEEFEGEEVAKDERWLFVKAGGLGNETIPVTVLVWLMTGELEGAIEHD
jgi:hypothetical protein